MYAKKEGSLKARNESLAFRFIWLQISFAIVLPSVHIIGVGYSTLSFTDVKK